MLLLFCFFELYSRQRGRLRQLRAPSLLDSSGLALLLLPPAPRQAGRDCSALCVLFSHSLLLCALLCGRSWQAELSFWVDDFILDFFQQYSSRHRKRMRQLRAPSLLDSSVLVPLLLLPAPHQAGRACSVSCVFSYSSKNSFDLMTMHESLACTFLL